MYPLKTIEKSLKTLAKYDNNFAKTSRETGIKVRTLRYWYNKQRNGSPLLKPLEERQKNYKWSLEQRKVVVDYYFEHGLSLTKVCKKFGYPKTSTLKGWVKKDRRYKQTHFIYKKPVSHNQEDKKAAVKDFLSRDISGEKIADCHNICRQTLYKWSKNMTGTTKKKSINIEESNSLEKEIQELIKAKQELEIENDILKKANEILKKEMGTNYSLLSNKEKWEVVSALKNTYKISHLLKIIHLKKDTYYYHERLKNNDKYVDVREKLALLFNSNYRCYGYRRLKKEYENIYGKILSEKVVRRLMKEEKLIVYTPKSKKKYSSYKGEISPAVENLIKRDFFADKPNEKLLTDITEFSLCDGKVYLSPLIDCFDGIPLTWTMGTSPSSELVNTMLLNGLAKIGDSKAIIHSDRGFHYRTNSWIKLMDENSLIRSMSKKGYSPDNSACEGFFGTLKNEFYYSNDWSHTTVSEFMDKLDEYLNWFTTKRIKMRLDYLNPERYMLEYQKQV